MSFKRNTVFMAVFAVFFIMMIASTAVYSDEKPRIAPTCKQCHLPAAKELRGTLGGISANAGTIQINTGPATWLVKFDENTKLAGAEKFSQIPREKEIAITFAEKEGRIYAENVSVKPPAEIPAEKILKVDELKKLVAMGTEKGSFTLVDSRPAPRYNEGFIPGAVNIYDADFDKNIEKLPKDKNRLLIFYCAGVT